MDDRYALFILLLLGVGLYLFVATVGFSTQGYLPLGARLRNSLGWPVVLFLRLLSGLWRK